MHVPSERADAKSLRVGSESRVWIGGHDDRARRVIESLVAPAERPATGPIDVAVITPKSADEAVYFAAKLVKRLSPDSVVWVVVSSDESGPSSAIATGLAELGLVASERVAIDDAFLAVGFQARRHNDN